jgi:Fic family protein
MLQEKLNYRQLTLLNHALKHPEAIYRIKSHQQSHNITYDTARTDLLKLADFDLLEKEQPGKAFVFRSPPDLRARLQKLDAA